MLRLACTGGQPFDDWLFAKGVDAGFNTLRFFAIGDNNDYRNEANLTEYALQPAPGQPPTT